MNKTKNIYPEIKIGNLFKLRENFHLLDSSETRKKINKNSIVTLVEIEKYAKRKHPGFYTFKILIDNCIRFIPMQTKYQFINSTVKHIKTK